MPNNFIVEDVKPTGLVEDTKPTFAKMTGVTITANPNAAGAISTGMPIGLLLAITYSQAQTAGLTQSSAKPSLSGVEDTISRNKQVLDVLPKNVAIDPQSLTRSYTVVIGARQLMMTVPPITYTAVGTVLQWGDSGGVTQ